MTIYSQNLTIVLVHEDSSGTRSMDRRLLLASRRCPVAARGQVMKGGHFFPKENPDAIAVLLKQFLSA